MKMMLKKLALTIFALVAALIAAEAGLRLLGMMEPRPRCYVGEHENQEKKNFVAAEHTGWKMRPDHVFEYAIEDVNVTYTSNKDGHRIADDPKDDVTVGGRPVVIIGDSFMWGAGVPFRDTVGALLAEAFPGRAVHNMAIPGFGVDQIWLSLQHWALPVEPATIIVGVYAGDFERSFSAYRDGEGFTKPAFKLDNGTLRRVSARDKPHPIVRFLEMHSHVFAAARSAERWAGRTLGVGTWWSLNAAFLDDMRQRCAAEGVQLLFVHIPYKDGPPFSALERYMAENDADYVDLLPLSDDQMEQYYFPEDGHLRAAGHHYMADRVATYLRTTGL